MNSSINTLSLKMELIWWAFTTILLVAVLLPIYNTVENYPFWISNAMFIIVFITLTRYIFLLRHTFLAKRQILKGVFIFLSIPFIFYLIGEINFFQTYLDEQGVEALIGNDISFNTRNRLAGFIRNEIMFFGIGSVIAALIFPFRMMMSIWTLRNRGRA